MSSHPGSQLSDAILLAQYLKRTGMHPEQVQDFYPTPGTLSTCMYHTGLDPRTMKPIYVAKSPQEKAMQRALMQFTAPQNHALVRRALIQAGRQDLIGWGSQCLVPPQDGRDARCGGKGGGKEAGTPKAKGGDGRQNRSAQEKQKKGC